MVSDTTLQSRFHATATAYSPRRVRFGQDFLSDPNAYQPDAFYSQRMNHALAFALKAHGSQKRKGRQTPYVAHLLSVAANVLTFAPIRPGHRILEENVLLKSTGHRVNITLEDAFIAALLHDAIEDQGGADMKERIRQRFDQARFGPVVSELVDYCTTHSPPPGAPPLDYNAKKRAQLIRVAFEAPQTATLIAACDKLANIRDTIQEYSEEGEAFWKRFKVNRSQKLRYMDDIVEVFKASGRHPQVVREIEQSVRRLHHLIRRNENPLVRWWHQRVVLPLRALVQALAQAFWPPPDIVPQPSPQG